MLPLRVRARVRVRARARVGVRARATVGRRERADAAPKAVRTVPAGGVAPGKG